MMNLIQVQTIVFSHHFYLLPDYRRSTSKTQFDPLLVNGTASKIEDIQGEHIAITGNYADMEKTMPAGRGIYRE